LCWLLLSFLRDFFFALFVFSFRFLCSSCSFFSAPLTFLVPELPSCFGF
jgi:hypothetical protein